MEVDAMEVDEGPAAKREAAFAGAGPQVFLDYQPAKCTQCGVACPVYPHLALMYSPQCDEGEMIFHRCQAPAVTEAIRKSQDLPFKSVGTDESGNPKHLKLVCYKCVGKALHGDEDYYVNLETGKLIKDWHHKQHLSKFPPSDKKVARMTKRAIEAIEEKQARPKHRGGRPMPSAEEVAHMLSGSSAAKAGTDWVATIGPDTYVLFGHKECDKAMLRQMQPHCHELNRCLDQDKRVGIYPLSSAKWLRLAGPEKLLVEGKTSAGANFAQWHCAACMGKYCYGEQAPYRLLVAGHSRDTKPGDAVFCAYIGTCLGKDSEEGSEVVYEEGKGRTKSHVEMQITLLKGAALLKKVGDVEVTPEKVLKAIQAFNVECEYQLGTMANVVSLHSGNHRQSKYRRRQLYCHSEALSIAYVGTPFLALAVDHETMPTLTPDLLQKWIDFCASFLDIEAYRPNGPAMIKAKKDLVERVAALKISSKM